MSARAPRLICLLLLLLLQLTLVCRSTADKCTNVCVCKWKSGKQTVECRKRGLNGVPDGIDPETQVLDASENNINFLPDKVFIRVRLTNLQRLYLRSCQIDRIERDALAGLTNLVELDLSHNRLSSVPSQSFVNTPFLRDLVLAHNPLRKIVLHAFKDAPNLVKLDLAHCELTELAAKGFQGLDMLETLKLNHNGISTLQQNTFEPLGKLTSIELHENPWTCDCTLREMKSWLVQHNLPSLIAPVCQGPGRLANRSFSELNADDFACRPVMAIVSRYAEATIGENASIVCTVTAIPPAKIKWIWNGKLYTNHSVVNSYQRILIYEEGKFFQKRSTLVLTNAQETDSSNFFCVAENQAGSVEANFTLHVSLRTAGMSTLGSGQIAGISAALVVLILFILLTIMVLFVRLRRMPQKDVKSPAPGSDNLPLDGCTSSNQDSGPANNPQSATSTVSRRKLEEVETTSFSESAGLGKPLQPAGANAIPANHGYSPRPVAASLLASAAQSHDYLINRGYEDGASRLHHQSILAPGPACYSSQASLMPIDNPDLIRDTRRGSSDEAAIASYASGEYSSSRLLDMDESKLLYSECLGWEPTSAAAAAAGSRTAVLPSVSASNPYKDLQPQQQLQQQQQQHQESFPPGAKQIRVWQKQGVPVLPPVSALKRVLSTRSSPDEGYQEGTGTDV